jgi:excisionase family DNA binding protein
MSAETENQPQRLLRVPDVARLLDVKEHRVRELSRQDLIPHIRIGRQLRFDLRQLEAWIEQGGKALPGGWKRALDDSAANSRNHK